MSSKVNSPTSNINLEEIIYNKKIEKIIPLLKVNENEIIELMFVLLIKEIEASFFNEFYEPNYNSVIFILSNISSLTNNKIKLLLKVYNTKLKIEKYILISDCKDIKNNYSKMQKDLEKIMTSLIDNTLTEDGKNVNKLIDFIFFDIKDISISKMIIEKYPKIIAYKLSNDGTFIKRVVNNYFNIIRSLKEKDGSMIDIDYYENILILIISNCQNNVKEKILNTIKKKISYLPNQFSLKITNQLEERIKLVINFNQNDNLDQKMHELSINKNNNCYDLTKEKIYTIDSKETNLRDDAISASLLPNGNYLLGIHIADVITFINRIYTLEYMLNNNLGLVDGISSSLYSLDSNCNRFANTYYFEIAKDGNIINFKVLKSIINVKKNIDNKSFIKILKDPSHEDFENVNLLYQLYQKFNLKFERKINDNKYNDEYVGNNIVECLMILTNYTIANSFYNNLFPLLYSINFHIPNNIFSFSNNNLYARVTSPIIDKPSRINQMLVNFYWINGINSLQEKLINEYLKRIDFQCNECAIKIKEKL